MGQNLAPQRFAQSLVTAVNNVTTTPQQVIGPNTTRTGITFHNPGNGTLVIFPLLVLVYGVIGAMPPVFGGDINRQGASQPLVPSITQLGGGFLLCSAATLFFGEPTCQQAWQALALGGANNPLTIMEQG